jgi:predicted nucleotidyltransferase
MEKAFVKKIAPIAKKIGVEYLYLFGSQARGKTNPRSDFDFAVKFKSNVKDKFKAKLGLMTALGKILEREDVDVTDIEKADPILNFNIIKDGKVIFSQNEKLRVMDKVKAMSVYFDRQYYFDRHFKAKLGHLASKGMYE